MSEMQMETYKSTVAKYNCMVYGSSWNGPTCKIRKMALNLYYITQDHYISEELFKEKVAEFKNTIEPLYNEILKDYAVLKSSNDVHSEQYIRRCKGEEKEWKKRPMTERDNF